MLLTKEIAVKWSSTNKKFLISKGYIFTKINNEIIVKIEDMKYNSPAIVEVQCDYCGKIISRRLQDYNKRRKNIYINKDCCANCETIRRKENNIYKQQCNLLTSKDKSYWCFKENILKELNDYIIHYNNLEYMYKNKWGAAILNSLQNVKVTLYELILELGYSITDLRKRIYKKEYDDFEFLKIPILKFIKQYNRFPTQKEIIYELHINTKIIAKHGGINNIKKMMKYYNKDDLVDKRGDINKSSYELIVANFLFDQGLANNYKREQRPFPKKEKRYKSDFTLYIEDKEIHIEIWGVNKNDNNSNIKETYNKKRVLKEDLYKKYKITLISINENIFKNNYKIIYQKLCDIFSPYVKINLKNIKYELINNSIITNEELLEKIMVYSSNNKYLPRICDIPYTYYYEILKRFGTYLSFSKYFDKDMSIKSNHYWEYNDNILKKLLEFKNKYYSLTNLKQNIINKDNDFKGLFGAITNNGGIIFNKLNCFDYCKNNNIPIAEDDINYIKNLVAGKFKNVLNLEECINRAKLLLKP